MKISQKIISNLKDGGADFFLSVPCKLLANMITILEADKDIYYSAIPREEEGMGICAGAYLGNKLPCIMMQNTGIGNSINSIGMASVTEEILDTLRIPVLHCNDVKDLDKISIFTNHAKIIENPVAILCNFNLMKED